MLFTYFPFLGEKCKLMMLSYVSIHPAFPYFEPVDQFL